MKWKLNHANLGLYTPPSGVDTNMLQTRAIDVVRVLDALANFAERLSPIIVQNKGASLWWFDSCLLIHRQHWISLSRHALALADLAIHPDGISGLSSSGMNDHWSKRGMNAELHIWPDWNRLIRSARRVTEAFGDCADFVGEGRSHHPPKIKSKTRR
jgi:hypothetical protein